MKLHIKQSYYRNTIVLLISGTILLAMRAGKSEKVVSAQKYNILFIFVDDLRPELGCYGNKQINSPNIDELASEAMLFTNQYVTVPTCGASRASILTGQLPQTIGDLSNDALEIKNQIKKNSSEPESFIEVLKRNGYYTTGIGKISHSPDGYIYKYTENKSKTMELPRSWDEMLFDAGKWGTGWNAFFGYADGSNRNSLKKQVKPYERVDVPDEGYPDGLTASLATKQLKILAAQKQPFFLAVGFFKPHLPFNAPAKYWDMYNEANIPLTPSPNIPEHVNVASLHQSSEFNNGYKLGDEKASLAAPISEAYARKLRHAYYASVSYVDAQVGKVLNHLKASGMDKNTIIVLWGDHGWHLGDDRVWGKHTLAEWSVRSPLIIKTPTMKKAITCNKIVNSTSIYPTILDLCNIPVPSDLDGSSLTLLLNEPDSKTWSNVAYSYFKKGISVRTERYRLTHYFREEQPDIELYDHATDPFEKKNIAADNPDIIKNLLPLLNKGNTGLYDNKIPKGN